jgi:hypothetical protein
LWQFRGIVGLAQTDDVPVLTVITGSDNRKSPDKLPQLLFTPLCFAENHNKNAEFQSDELQGLFDAANSGNSDAQWRLAQKYEFGTEIPRDILSAFYWYKMSAFGGNANGQHRLSRCYMESSPCGIKKNIRLTLVWLILSSEKGRKRRFTRFKKSLHSFD